MSIYLFNIKPNIIIAKPLIMFILGILLLNYFVEKNGANYFIYDESIWPSGTNSWAPTKENMLRDIAELLGSMKILRNVGRN